MKILERKKIPYVSFQEPDLDRNFTAVACVADGKVFGKLKLMKF